MGVYSQQQLENFFKKSEKFFNSHYLILDEAEGMLTKVLTEKMSYSLVHSIDRHHLICEITQDLIKIMCFESEEANQIAFYYVDLKYKEYCDYMMNL